LATVMAEGDALAPHRWSQVTIAPDGDPIERTPVLHDTAASPYDDYFGRGWPVAAS
jgi:hypothetical protein